MQRILKESSYACTGEMISFLSNLIHKLTVRTSPYPPRLISQMEPDPPRRKIVQEPFFALKDGFLVVVVDHSFDDVPSWVEWDAARKVLSIAQMNGQIDEAHAEIAPNHYETLQNSRKLLLVSNDNKEKIVHFLPFLAR